MTSSLAANSKILGRISEIPSRRGRGGPANVCVRVCVYYLQFASQLTPQLTFGWCAFYANCLRGANKKCCIVLGAYLNWLVSCMPRPHPSIRLLSRVQIRTLANTRTHTGWNCLKGFKSNLYKFLVWHVVKTRKIFSSTFMHTFVCIPFCVLVFFSRPVCCVFSSYFLRHL